MAFRKNKQQPKSQEQRLNEAAATEGAALSIFQQAAEDIARAADEYTALADEQYEESKALRRQAEAKGFESAENDDRAMVALERADRVRSLFA